MIGARRRPCFSRALRGGPAPAAPTTQPGNEPPSAPFLGSPPASSSSLWLEGTKRILRSLILPPTPFFCAPAVAAAPPCGRGNDGGRPPFLASPLLSESRSTHTHDLIKPQNALPPPPSPPVNACVCKSPWLPLVSLPLAPPHRRRPAAAAAAADEDRPRRPTAVLSTHAPSSPSLFHPHLNNKQHHKMTKEEVLAAEAAAADEVRSPQALSLSLSPLSSLRAPLSLRIALSPRPPRWPY